MSDLMEQVHPAQPLKREHDSTDDFEHLEHHQAQQQNQQPQQSLLDLSLSELPPQPHNLHDGLDSEMNILDTSIPASNNAECNLKPVPATPPPSADFCKVEEDPMDRLSMGAAIWPQKKDEKEVEDPNTAFIKGERPPLYISDNSDNFDEYMMQQMNKYVSPSPPHKTTHDDPNFETFTKSHGMEDAPLDLGMVEESLKQHASKNLFHYGDNDCEIKSSTLPEPEKSPELDFVKDEIIVHQSTKVKPKEDESWNILEKANNEIFGAQDMLHDEAPSRPLPPLPKGAVEEPPFDDKFVMSNDFLLAEAKNKATLSGGETGDSEFESEPEPSPAKTSSKSVPAKPELGDAAVRKHFTQKPEKTSVIDEIAPKQIFRDIGIDAWFNPERLNPKVAALIYWRDPKKSGIVFGATLGVLLSLAYFSLISVLAYISLLTLTGTVSFRIYKTVLQAIQKTSDGHPFKSVLDLDLALPTEKVHELADIAVANANAAVSELRRLFLVEDFVDSLKFGILLWSLTYLGAWFNGMTLIIIGVVALFTLPKVYETNKTQIDQNLALVQAKINEITAKVKAAMPLGKKADALKEE